jgi:hypothetical protein
MHKHYHTDAELAYWLKKYLIYRGTRLMMALITKGGGGLLQLMTAAASQDLIGWTEFLHGKISVDIEYIQHIHCSLSPCQITGSDWMKTMASHLMQASHCQMDLLELHPARQTARLPVPATAQRPLMGA